MVLPPQHVIEATEEAQRLRGWVANGYAQVEYLLGDIIMKAQTRPEYSDLQGRLPHGAPRRIREVEKILDIEGFFSAFEEEIRWLLEAFKLHHETRNLLAHGFCSIYHTPAQEVGFEFRKWHRDEENGDVEITKIFQLTELEYEKTQLVEVSSRALDLSRKMHEGLGLIDD